MNPLHLKLTYITNTEQVYLIVSIGKANCNYVARFNFFIWWKKKMREGYVSAAKIWLLKFQNVYALLPSFPIYMNCNTHGYFIAQENTIIP